MAFFKETEKKIPQQDNCELQKIIWFGIKGTNKDLKKTRDRIKLQIQNIQLHTAKCANNPLEDST